LDLDISSDQELFLDTTRRFLTATWPTSSVRRLIDQAVRTDRDLMGKGAELGWTSMLIPDEHGGGSVSGDGVADLAIVIEELGRFLVPGPVLSTNLVAFALAREGSDQVAKEYLPNLAAGIKTATWAVSEGDDPEGRSGALHVTRTESEYRLSGSKWPVPDANAADVLLVSVSTGDGGTQVLVEADSPGITIRPLEGLDVARRYCRVEFDDVRVALTSGVGQPHQGDSAMGRQLALALALQCAEMVGAADRLYEMTLAYVKDRKSFGRPIGSYQALKHRLAQMLFWLESSKAATAAAVAAVQADDGALEAALVAKAYLAVQGPLIARDCMQMHGGIGYTWEHDVHLFLRRIEADAALLGGRDYALDRLAEMVGFEEGT
jgi:alkylation response protein AidB-like acyl-CoA dehydrogenase